MESKKETNRILFVLTDRRKLRNYKCEISFKEVQTLKILLVSDHVKHFARTKNEQKLLGKKQSTKKHEQEKNELFNTLLQETSHAMLLRL